MNMKPKAHWNHGKRRGRPKVAISSTVVAVYKFLPEDGSKVGAAELRKKAAENGMSFTTLYKNLNQLVDIGLVHRSFDTSQYPPLVYYARAAPYLMGPSWQFPELKIDDKTGKDFLVEILRLEGLWGFCDLLKKSYQKIEDEDFRSKARKAMAMILKGIAADRTKTYLLMIKLANLIENPDKKKLFVEMFTKLILSEQDSFIIQLISGMPKEVFDEVLPDEALDEEEILKHLDRELFAELANDMKKNSEIRA